MVFFAGTSRIADVGQRLVRLWQELEVRLNVALQCDRFTSRNGQQTGALCARVRSRCRSCGGLVEPPAARRASSTAETERIDGRDGQVPSECGKG